LKSETETAKRREGAISVGERLRPRLGSQDFAGPPVPDDVHASATRLLGLLAASISLGCAPLTPTSAHDAIDHGDDSVSEAPPALLPPASPDAYRLPWACGKTYPVTQGNHGDICGVHGDHVGVQEFAWDFGLPMGTPVLATRAGVVTLAATLSPPGSSCHDGCPFRFASPEQIACCAICLYAANRVNVLHDDGAISTYAHLDQVVVPEGQRVRAGELLGYSGTSGCSTGPHLHFQVMAGCDEGFCQSLPLTFDEAGIPACGDQVMSQNSCG
jgi:murein DD-endopeptidase MepM/ murein hydrolase activator NlpD